MFVICDVDGTVCRSAQPLDNDTVGILRALAITHRLVFISGTDAEELRRMITGPLACDHWVLAEYGAYGYGCTDNIFLPYNGFNEMITVPDREKIVVVLRRCLEYFNIQSMADDIILDRACQLTVSCLGRSAREQNKKLFDRFGYLRLQMIDWLKERLGNSYVYHIGGMTSIDIGHITKRDGIVRFLRGQDNKDAVFVGDAFGQSGNDRSVIGLMPCFVVDSPADFPQVAGLINRL